MYLLGHRRQSRRAHGSRRPLFLFSLASLSSSSLAPLSSRRLLLAIIHADAESLEKKAIGPQIPYSTVCMRYSYTLKIGTKRNEEVVFHGCMYMGRAHPLVALCLRIMHAPNPLPSLPGTLTLRQPVVDVLLIADLMTDRSD